MINKMTVEVVFSVVSGRRDIRHDTSIGLTGHCLNVAVDKNKGKIKTKVFLLTVNVNFTKSVFNPER